MDGTPTGVANRRPVFYAGRFAERVADAGLPEGHDVIGDWEVLPAELAAAVDRATTLVILDPFSFPFEALVGAQRDVPLVVVVPPGFGFDFLTAVFGGPVFERLDSFDRVAVGDPVLWEALRRRYRWTEGQRVAVVGADPEEAALEIGALLEEEAAASPAGRGPDKATHRVQRAALEPQFAAARGARAEDVPFDVIGVGAGIARWASRFDLVKTRFVGLDEAEGMAAVAREDFPEADFDRLGEDLLLPYRDESFDLAFCVGVTHRNPAPSKRTLLSEMWRVTKPGGRLLFLEDFVTPRREREGSAVYPVSVLEFVELLLEATAWQAVLEHVESVRYPQDDFVRGGVLALSKLGVPKTW